MSILVDKSNTFPVEVVVGMTTDIPPKVLCVLKENEEVVKTWPATFVVSEHKFTFRPIDFITNSRAIDKAVDINGIGGMKINGAILRFHRLLSSMVSWSLVDEKKQPIPITAETVGALPLEVAQVLCDEIDKSQNGV